MIIVVMGVCGSGKTTIGSLLAEKIGCSFADADQFHSEANKAKMSTGHPLTDEDRIPWLLSIHHYILYKQRVGESHVVTCSALKRAYRNILKHGNPFGTRTKEDTSCTANQLPREETSNGCDVEGMSNILREESKKTETFQGTSQTIGNPRNRITGTSQTTANPRNTAGEELDQVLKVTKGDNSIMDHHYNSDGLNPIFVHLTASIAVLEERLQNRKGHFMPKSLLQSQVDTLESLSANEVGFSVDIDKSKGDIVNEILLRLNL